MINKKKTKEDLAKQVDKKTNQKITNYENQIISSNSINSIFIRLCLSYFSILFFFFFYLNLFF